MSAPADGDGGANGLYLYTSAPAMPTESWDSSNYWVDVVFMPDDVTPPTVATPVPASGSCNFPCQAPMSAVFSEPLDSTTVDANTVELRGPGDVPVAAGIHYDSASRTISLSPVQALADTTTYTVILHGGSAGPRLRDLASNALAADVTWSFKTELEGTLGVGVSRPIALALSAQPNPSHGAVRLALEVPPGGYQSLDVMDVTGRVVRRLGPGVAATGNWSIRWDARDDSGRALPAGLYFARLRTRDRAATARVILVP